VSGKSIYIFTPAPYGDSLLLQYPGAKAILSSPDKHITKLKLSFLDPGKRMKGLAFSKLFALEPGILAENP
jgi:hypothetical protein